MKSSTQIFAVLVAALATLSQSAIATPRRVTAQLNIKGYEIKNFQQYRDLTMGCGIKVNLYVATNKKSTFGIQECEAFVVRDSYYKEYLFLISTFNNSIAANKINVCSAGKAIFNIGVSSDSNTIRFSKCQTLVVRTKDSQYIYAGYVTPTVRIH